MKKILFLFSLALFSQTLYSQTVDFMLKQDGKYETKDGSSYVIIDYSGKTAHDIFEMLKSNAIKFYSNASEVMTIIEDKMITFYALGESLMVNYVLGIPVAYSGFYKYTIEIKDERIKINAPEVDKVCNLKVEYINAENDPLYYSFSVIVNKAFKKGVIREKYVQIIKNAEDKMNGYINAVIKQPILSEEW